MSERKDSTLPEIDPARPAGRREFLVKGAAAAVAVTGMSTVLAACGESATAPAAASEPLQSPGALRSLAGGRDPGQTLHLMVAGTIGSSPDCTVPALEKGTTTTYVQRVITNVDRIGTGLATVLKSSYKFSNGTTVSVIVQNSSGVRWTARRISTQSDLAYAMKDALSTNTLSDGVLKDSLSTGKPIVALIKASIIQFQDSVASDYYGNHNDVAARGFCDIFNPSVGGYPIASTTRDLRRC